MTILEVIKKGIKYADGFEIINQYRFPDRFEMADFLKYGKKEAVIREGMDGLLIYQHFLTRIIEGINREYVIYEGKNYCIDIISDDIEVGYDMYTRKHHFTKDYNSIDECKLAAITYVLEQEPTP